MLDKFKLVAKSSRFYLWPATAINACFMSLVVGAERWDSIILGLSLCCLASFGFLVNDISDRNVDRLNTAGRLEVADNASLRLVGMTACVFLVLGTVLALLIGPKYLLISALIAGGLTAYSIGLRRVLLAATLLSALLSTAPLWVPLVLWSDSGVLLGGPALVSGVYLMFVARETILDIKDSYGDRIVGRHTFATVYGDRIASLLASSATIAAGLVFLAAAIQASVVEPLRAIPLWLSLLLFVLLGIVPGLTACAGDRDDILVYIKKSRIAMKIFPLILMSSFLVR